MLDGWRKLADITPEQISLWSRMRPAETNTGILTARTPALDIDILDPDAAAAIEDLVRDRFGERGAILVRFGQRPKRAIPFRALAPFPKIVVNFSVSEGAPGEKLEMLCGGQQVIVAGIHPDTLQPYEWFGGSPGEVKHDDLPCIRSEEAQALTDAAAALLVERFGYRLQTSSRAKDPNEPRPADWSFTPDDLIDHDRLAALAMRLLKSGMNAGAVVNFLRASVEALDGVDEDRRQRRLKEIPNMVSSAQKKLDREERKDSNEQQRSC
jgi:hypothetical protein